MVRLWNSVLSGRNADGTCDTRGLTYISEPNFKAFEADLAEDAARTSSLAAMRAGDPHGMQGRAACTCTPQTSPSTLHCPTSR